MRQSTTKPYPIVLLLGLLLAACGGAAEPTQAPTGLDPLEQFVPVISATGEVVPVRWALIGAPSSGIVAELLVSEGEVVEAGQPLLRIGGQASLQAALAVAQYELAAAQQALDQLHEQAGVMASQAQLELANARDALEDAEYRWRSQQQGYRASPETVRAAEARLLLAEEREEAAKDRYDHFSGRSSDDAQRAAALVDWVNAQHARDDALRNVNWYTGHPTEVQQAMLDAEVAMAESRLREAEREWKERRDGPAADELALAQARLANARAQVAAAETALEDLVIRAPFAGTVSALHARQGEWLVIGSPVLLLADLEELRVETTDLNELDVARIEAGDAASVAFDALPDMVVDGTVVSIAPKADEGAGVNYTVVIALAETPAALRWDMTAFVDIEVQQD